MAGNFFVDRTGRVIKKAEWEALRVKAGYVMIREYENGKFVAELQWSGVVDNTLKDQMHRTMWPVYDLCVYNLVPSDDGTVRKIRDPAFTRTYHSEEYAIERYNNFLAGYTACELTEEEITEENGTVKFVQNLVERDNLRSPEAKAAKEFQEHYDANEAAGSW